MNARLGPDEWINAALRVLAEHGIDAVRVESLAKTLSVTKGSFYWHFADRPALLEAMLNAWKARATHDIIALVETQGGDARARLLTLGRTVFSADGRLDRQIRVWAANDWKARAAQDEIDAGRMAYVVALFENMGLAPEHAKARALFIYNALIGQFAIGTPGRLDGEQLTIVLNLLVQD